MPPPFHRKASTVRPIETPEPTVGRVDPATLATALGAEPTGERAPGGSPISRYAVGTELYRRGKSKTVLLEIAGTDKRVEMQISASDWIQLEELASTLGAPGSSPSAGQVASILLRLALDVVKPVTTGPSTDRAEPELARRLAEEYASQT
jgi:hypothetical protein